MDRWRGLNSSSVFKRIMFVMLFVGVFAFLVLIGKLFQVQVVAYEEYQQKAVSQQTRNEILTPSRGTIYDSNMNVLEATELYILKWLRSSCHRSTLMNGTSIHEDMDLIPGLAQWDKDLALP